MTLTKDEAYTLAGYLKSQAGDECEDVMVKTEFESWMEHDEIKRGIVVKITIPYKEEKK